MSWRYKPQQDNHDVDDLLHHIIDGIQELHDIATTTNQNTEQIMSDQAHLDSDVAALTATLGAIGNEIDQLKGLHPSIDFTGLDAALTSAAGLVPAPVVDPPVDTTAPVDAPPADAPPADAPPA